MDKHICQRCKEVTYPDSWCGCDPRRQMEDFLIEECVYLMPDEVEVLSD